MTPSGIEHATFWLVAQCLNQLKSLKIVRFNLVFKSGALVLAASGRLLTAAALVRSRCSPCEISSGQSGTGTGFPLGT